MSNKRSISDQSFVKVVVYAFLAIIQTILAEVVASVSCQVIVHY